MTTGDDARRWRMRLQMLREDMRSDIQAVRGLRSVERRRTILDELLADLDRQLDRSEAAAVITLVGATGAGKSTLLNALARQEIAREGVNRPTTSEATIYAPRDADVTALAGTTTDESGPRIVRYAPMADGADAHVYVDAPDMNSIEASHAARLRDLAQRSDVLLVVLHRQSVVEAAPVEFLDGFARRRALLFVLNRADELTDDARAALLAQIKTLAAERWQAAEAPVIAISARRAREEPEGADRQRVMQAISSLLGGQSIQRIRRHNALGTTAMLAEVFGEVRNEIGDDLRALPGDVAAGVEGLAQRLADIGEERWQLQRTDMNELLWNESARRWQGPGGWALRVGGAEAIGVGAAGILARSHPLLAIGTAVSAAAASGVRKVVQDRRLYENNPLLPAASDLDDAYRSALAPARIRAGRLTEEAERLGLPGADEAGAEVAASVDAAWRGLVDRDLPKTADRSALRYFRWLIDLPVYALVAWLVYRAAAGFVDGSYVGVDLLLNSALLAVVYLFLVRVVVRAGLRRRAHGLLESAAQASRDGLERWRDRVSTEVSERVDVIDGALECLAELDQRWRSKLQAL